ncbi:MAG TPA: HEAT repeat domain-containing protein [Methylomirabilota bacterium]|nr:HEAT repeat domain-containing protein [Methylomirabilota bacterium]
MNAFQAHRLIATLLILLGPGLLHLPAQPAPNPPPNTPQPGATQNAAPQAATSALAPIPIEELRQELEKHRRLAGTGQENRGLMRKLRVELARRGDPEEREAIFSELKSEDRARQYMAIEDTAKIGDREAIRHLGELLQDPDSGGRYVTRGPDGERIVSDQAFLAPSMVAAMKLATLIENPVVPPIGPDKKFYTQKDVELWQEWWKTHREAYEP